MLQDIETLTPTCKYFIVSAIYITCVFLRFVLLQEANVGFLLVKSMKTGMDAAVRGIAGLVPTNFFNLNIPDFKGCTFLQYAISHRNRAMVKFFLNIDDIDVNVRALRDSSSPRNKATALRFAIDEVDADVVAALLSFADVDVNAATGDGVTPLQCAIMLGNVDVVAMLARHADVKLNAQDRRGNAHLHHALTLFGKKGRVAMVELLLSLEGVDVNLRNVDGLTPLELALELRRTDVVELLYNHAK